MPKAVRLTEELLTQHFDQIGELSLIPSSGGVFEVRVNGELIFSKKQLGRFPEDGEIQELLQGKF